MKERGFTLIELLIVVGVIGAVAAIAIPSVMRARISGNEASAIGSMRAIASAEATYASSAGSGNYAVLLGTLGVACPGGTQGFISSDLTTDPSAKSGYRMTLQASAAAMVGANDCNGTATRTAYYSTAVPISNGISGHRAFASSAGGAIYFDITGAPPTEAQMAPGGGGQTLR